MSQKVALIADPGIDTAFAVALALTDPALDVVGLAATAGNVPHEQATVNVHTLIDQLDPPRWPRLGAALHVQYELDGRNLHGSNGLGGIDFPTITKHQQTPSDKLLVELVRQSPGELTVISFGPLTTLARALDRDPEFGSAVKQVVCLGGAWHEPGNASAVAEFHIACDPEAAQQVLSSGVPTLLIPLDAMRKVVFSPSDLLELPNPTSRTCQFLRQIVAPGIRATSNLYGIEGFHLKDVLGIVAVSRPGLLTTKPTRVDVEVRGELTRGMTVVDVRPDAGRPNVDLAVGVDTAGVRDYIMQTLRRAE